MADTPRTPEELTKALRDRSEPDLNDQGDIAADDAGATAMAERVTKSAGVQGAAPGDEGED